MSDEDNIWDRLGKIAVSLEELQTRSEERNDKVYDILQLFIASMTRAEEQRMELVRVFEQRLHETQEDKFAAIQRMDKRLERAEKRYEEIFLQTQMLVAMINEKDKQISGLEDRLMMKHDSISIGGITNNDKQDN